MGVLLKSLLVDGIGGRRTGLDTNIGSRNWINRDSSPSLPFKSKKILNSSKPPQPSDEKPGKEQPATPLRRSGRCLMSVKAVREAAAKLREAAPSDVKRKPDPIFSLEMGDGRKGKVKKKKADDGFHLPEKHELLCKFFNSLDCSLKLLKLKSYKPVLQKITPQIESLTDRRFSIVHLAQLKFILPEAIELKKENVMDEKTFCMKPDIHVTLKAGAINDNGGSNNVIAKPDLKNIFRARMVDFVKAHPEEEVPEGPLPEPFTRSNINLPSTIGKASSPVLLDESSAGAITEQLSTSASHLSRTFQRRFSKQASSQSPAKSVAKPITQEKGSYLGDSRASIPCSPLPETPMKGMGFVINKVSSSEGTPSKVISTPTSATPALPPQKRSFMTPDADSPNKLVKRPPRTRSLKFDTPIKSAKVEDEGKSLTGDLSSDDDIFDILPASLVQSIREKELKIQEESDPAISQAKRRKQLLASLPKFYDMIRYTFQSSKTCLITKEELVHKLVTTQVDIVDQKEVEEQFVLLKELVPELIYEKFSSSGDLFIGINKISSPELIHTRLVEAKTEAANKSRL